MPIIKASLYAVKVGDFLYASFRGNKGDVYYTRYSLDPEKSCDFVAFQYYPNGQKYLMEVINAD
ncbi:hypothetical protein D3C78_1464210 [compost metagenome]